LDETAKVKEVDVIDKSTELSNREECGSSSSSTDLSFQSNNCAFDFEIITVKIMNKMFLNNVHLPILQSYDTIPPPPGGTAILPEYIHYYGYYYQVIVQCL
jgi:hypothetical protein